MVKRGQIIESFRSGPGKSYLVKMFWDPLFSVESKIL